MEIRAIANIWLNYIVLSMTTTNISVSDEFFANVTNDKVDISALVYSGLSVFFNKVYLLCIVSTLSQNFDNMPFGDSSLGVRLLINDLNLIQINLLDCNDYWIE